MSDETNDNLNIVSSGVVRATLKKLGKKKTHDSEAVAPIAEPKFSDPKSRFLDELYKQHWTDLCGWLYRRYGSGPPEPEDIAQTAFEKIAAIDDIRTIRNPRAFLYTVAVHSALMKVRWLVQARKYIDGELTKENNQVEKITPERIYVERERFNLVLKEMEKLTEKQREIVIRSRIKGQTYDEICADTGWSPAVISRNLKAAMVALYRAESSLERKKDD